MRAYTYPDEDFCLFNEFPHSQMIAPVLILDKQMECSCSLRWLHTHWKRYHSVKSFDYNQFIYDNVPFLENLTSGKMCFREEIVIDTLMIEFSNKIIRS